jgi:hypothetical protein
MNDYRWFLRQTFLKYYLSSDMKFQFLLGSDFCSKDKVIRLSQWDYENLQLPKRLWQNLYNNYSLHSKVLEVFFKRSVYFASKWLFPLQMLLITVLGNITQRQLPKHKPVNHHSPPYKICINNFLRNNVAIAIRDWLSFYRTIITFRDSVSCISLFVNSLSPAHPFTTHNMISGDALAIQKKNCQTCNL